MNDAHEIHKDYHHEEMKHDSHAQPDVKPSHFAHPGHEMHDSASAQSEHASHIDHSGHEDMFRARFWISLLLSIPVLLYTPDRKSVV